VYRNWVHTEEISYTYHDKSGRLRHFSSIVAQPTDRKAAVQIDEISLPGSKMFEIQSLQETQKKIKELEKKIKDLEKRIPQRYPDVRYLNYRSRKRILVSIKKNAACMQPVYLDRLVKKSSYPNLIYYMARITGSVCVLSC
jgi:hypothetical protein